MFFHIHLKPSNVFLRNPLITKVCYVATHIPSETVIKKLEDKWLHNILAFSSIVTLIMWSCCEPCIPDNFYSFWVDLTPVAELLVINVFVLHIIFVLVFLKLLWSLHIYFLFMLYHGPIRRSDVPGDFPPLTPLKKGEAGMPASPNLLHPVRAHYSINFHLPSLTVIITSEFSSSPQWSFGDILYIPLIPT